MTVSSPFIARPIATTLLVAGVLLLGLLGYRLLPVAALPSVDLPTIEVVAQLPGAGPDVTASSLTAPLEHQFGQISGLTSMNSTSSLGTSRITLQFGLGRDIDGAAQDVQAAINGASGLLPLKLMPSPPTYSKVNPADTPILILALTSDTLPLRKLADYADTVITQKLSQIDGVGLVSVEGSQKRAIRIEANPTVLAGLGLTLADIRAAVTAATVDLPKGSLDGQRQAFQIESDDQLLDADAYGDTVIAYRGGAAVRIRDVAQIVDGVQDDKQAAWYDNKPAVILDIQRQPGVNVIELVEAIRSQLPLLRAAIPSAVKIDVLTDRTLTIRASIASVQSTLLLTIGLVILVIFLFLGEFRAAIVPSVALPVSLIATFGVMALAHFSLDNLSLMALTIAAGFVVDDAIVMVENIVRYIEAGETPMRAALKGSAQIGFTIVSLTLSLIAVFVPLLLMGGVVGRLFREFSITLSAAVVISAAVSLTLTPMMCAQFLGARDADRPTASLLAWSEAWFDRLRDFYDAGLRWALAHRATVHAFTVLMMLATIMLYVDVPKGFLPQQDTGIIIGTAEAAPGISFAAMADKLRKIAERMRQDPDVAAVSAFVGAGPVNATGNAGRLFLSLQPFDHRSAGADAVMQRLRAAVGSIEGVVLHLQSVQDVQIETRVSPTQYQYTLQDANVAELASWAPKLLAELRLQKDLADVSSDQQAGGFEAALRINRDAASRLRVSVQAIDDALYDAFGQRQIATIYTQENQYRVILEAAPGFRDGPDALRYLKVKSATGEAVPLSSVTTAESGTIPLARIHQGLFPATTLSFNLPEGGSLGAALQAISRAEQIIGLPHSIATRFSGSAAEFQTSLASELGLILAAIVTVYIVLGVLYESYIHPITILSALPPAGIGALLALLATGYDLNVISLVAIILLIGIVKKNAIMMVDFAIEAEREGYSPEAAIRQACLLRFRPIMMTTVAALLAAVPLAFDTTAGSELRRPFGIAVGGGLFVSQFLTLYTTPVTYLAFGRISRSLRRWLTRSAPVRGGESEARPVPIRRGAESR